MLQERKNHILDLGASNDVQSGYEFLSTNSIRGKQGEL